MAKIKFTHKNSSGLTFLRRSFTKEWADNNNCKLTGKTTFTIEGDSKLIKQIVKQKSNVCKRENVTITVTD